MGRTRLTTSLFLSLALLVAIPSQGIAGHLYLTPIKSLVSTWAPLSSSNIKVDFESDVNVTNSSGKASQWVDQKSGITVVQATSANQPTINAGSLNGLQTLTFNGSTTRLTTASAPPYKLDSASPFSIYVVCKLAAFSGTQYFSAIRFPISQDPVVTFSFSFSNDPSYADIYLSSRSQATYSPLQRSGSLGLDTSAFRVYKVFYNGGGLTLANYGYQKDSNTVLTPVTNGGTAYSNTVVLTIGADYTDSNGTSGQFFNGDIAAIYMFNADLRPSGTNEDSNMMTYLQSKYGAGI